MNMRKIHRLILECETFDDVRKVASKVLSKLYWRGRIYDHYNVRRWANAQRAKIDNCMSPLRRGP